MACGLPRTGDFPKPAPPMNDAATSLPLAAIDMGSNSFRLEIGQLKAGRYARYVIGVHTGAKLSDGKNYNLRARMWRGVTEENARERTIREHRSIVVAIRERQPVLARAWMTVHIAGVEDWLRNATDNTS